MGFLKCTQRVGNGSFMKIVVDKNELINWSVSNSITIFYRSQKKSFSDQVGLIIAGNANLKSVDISSLQSVKGASNLPAVVFYENPQLQLEHIYRNMERDFVYNFEANKNQTNSTWFQVPSMKKESRGRVFVLRKRIPT